MTKLRQLMLVEEFKRCIQSDVKTFLDEKQVETLEEAARLADDYYLTHKVSFIAKPKPTSSHPQNKFMSGNSSGMPSQSNTPKPNSTSETKSQYPLSRPACNYCKKPGHLVSECLKLKRKLESDEAKPTGLTTLRPRPQSSIKTNTTDIVTKHKSFPAFDEPFSWILIDCVGPLPRTKSGNEYLLTIMCTSTRFPEAIPLRNIKTKSIVKALMKFFTFVGLPKSVQSDQGSNFMSGIFQQVMHELGIKQYRSSAYHPESQGALERFHQTLKNMIRSYCFDTEKDWDEGIHLLLFAVRESVQESLGFSPFELVFCHSVRGPLKLLKEKFLSNDETPLNLLQYVSDFRNRLSRACEVARSNLKMSRGKMKARYDNHVIDRKFKPGDKVLALLPIPGRLLQARYFGPYTIDKKTSDLNYIINTPGRHKKKCVMQIC